MSCVECLNFLLLTMTNAFSALPLRERMYRQWEVVTLCYSSLEEWRYKQINQIINNRSETSLFADAAADSQDKGVYQVLLARTKVETTTIYRLVYKINKYLFLEQPLILVDCCFIESRSRPLSFVDERRFRLCCSGEHFYWMIFDVRRHKVSFSWAE